MFNNGVSLADIAAVTGNNRNNDGMWGDGAWWIVILLIFGWTIRQHQERLTKICYNIFIRAAPSGIISNFPHILFSKGWCEYDK